MPIPPEQVIVTTGDIRYPYDIIDVVFTIGSHQGHNGFLINFAADPSRAFGGVKAQLKQQCANLGGDAVIHCQFEYRMAMNGKHQVMEIFAYGTAIRYAQTHA